MIKKRLSAILLCGILSGVIAIVVLSNQSNSTLSQTLNLNGPNARNTTALTRSAEQWSSAKPDPLARDPSGSRSSLSIEQLVLNGSGISSDNASLLLRSKTYHEQLRALQTNISGNRDAQQLTAAYGEVLQDALETDVFDGISELDQLACGESVCAGIVRFHAEDKSLIEQFRTRLLNAQTRHIHGFVDYTASTGQALHEYRFVFSNDPRKAGMTVKLD